MRHGDSVEAMPMRYNEIVKEYQEILFAQPDTENIGGQRVTEEA